jgi:uncharacterized membrane protein
MANISAIKKVEYTINATDIANGYVTIPVLWDSPFYDTSYAISLAVESLDTANAQNAGDVLFSALMTAVTSAGFTATVLFQLSSQSPITSMDIILHAMASHK